MMTTKRRHESTPGSLALRTRALTCGEALRQADIRVQLLEPKLRALITWVGDDARSQARERDAAAARGDWLGPLSGVLMGLKDNIETKGLRTTSGSRLFQWHVPSRDAAVVRRLKQAGAVIVAKCNMAELAWGATTQNATFGSCRNPWDPDRIPGGSSGGSGVAVAAGFCDMALGTDTGASTRVPACVNGVVGLRPTFGRISNTGITPVSPSHDTVGPMCKTVIDVARLTAVLTAWDPEDPFSMRPQGTDPTSQLDRPVSDLRVGVLQGYFAEGVDDGVAACVGEALQLLERLGAQLIPMKIDGAADAGEHWTRIVSAESAVVHSDDLASRAELFSPDVFHRISEGLGGSRAELAESVLWRARYDRRVTNCFTEVDVLVAPTIGTDVPFVTGYDSREQTRSLGTLTYPWALYRGPTINLPVGFHPRSGMPVGLAVAAAPWEEAVTFALGAHYQRQTEWHRIEPAIVAKALENPEKHDSTHPGKAP